MAKRDPELYVAVDLEADGPIPGPYSMLSLGMAVVNRPELTFYIEMQPMTDDFVPEAMAVNGLDRERLKREAAPPKEAMQAAADWIDGLRKHGRPVFLAAPAVWDGMYLHWYFLRFLGRNPFGVTGSGIDLRSYWMGAKGVEWRFTGKDRVKHDVKLKDLPHTHHALEDAQELAEIFAAVLEKRKQMKG